MDSEPRDLDIWMQEMLNSWAEQGALPSEKSAQLRVRVARLARQERKNRFIRKVYGLAAAIITCIWMLFASCPVAAASYVNNPIYSAPFAQVNAVCIVALLIGFFINHPFRVQTNNINFEVKYE